jgi:hypothetical protein
MYSQRRSNNAKGARSPIGDRAPFVLTSYQYSRGMMVTAALEDE